MRSTVYAAVLLLLFTWVFADSVSPLPELPSERRAGVTYVPGPGAIEAPTALDAPAPENSDHVRYDEFPSPLAAAEDSADSWMPADLPQSLIDADVEDLFDRFITLFEDTGSRLGPVRIGALPRSIEVPFALMPSDSDRYEATVWSGLFEYAPLYLELDESAWIIDLGTLYEMHLADGSPGGALSDGSRPGGAASDGEAGPSHAFLPAAPVEAGVTHFESFDGTFIDVHARTLITLDNPSMEPATVRLLLRPGDESMELAGLFITHLAYPSGSTYSVHLEETGDATGVLEEHMLASTALTERTTRYRLSIGEHRLFRGRFVRSASSATVWEETFPQPLMVAEQEAGVYDEPRGRKIGELAREARVRAVEPWNRLDSRDGVEGMWYRVETGSERGWMWAPDLTEPRRRE